MIFQYIYVFNAVFLYSLLGGSNQVICKKNRNGRRHYKPYAKDYFINTEEREDFVKFNRYRSDYELDARRFQVTKTNYGHLHMSKEEMPKSHIPKQFNHPVLLEDFEFNALVTKNTRTLTKLKNELNTKTTSNTRHQDYPNIGSHRSSRENDEYNKKKSSESLSKSSEETKRVKNSARSHEKRLEKYKKLKHLQGTNLKQMLDIEALLTNPNILHTNKPKPHAHHTRPTSQEVETIGHQEAETTGHQEAETTGHHKVETTGHDKVETTGHHKVETTGHDKVETTGHHKIDVHGHPNKKKATSPGMDHGTGAEDANDPNNGVSSSNGSPILGDSALSQDQDDSDANGTAILPPLNTTNIFNDKSPETLNTNPGYGDKYIYILLDPAGTAERHDLTCHPKIKMGSEIKTAPDKINIKLYTRAHSDEPEILKNVKNENFKLRFSSVLQSFNFCKNKDLKVLTHGHTNPAETLEFLEDLKDTYLDESDVNVIIVDWKQISDSPYMLMARLYEPVSIVLAHLLDALIKTFKYQKSIHLIGHGVGAHIMGYVSNYCKHEIYRITGLDPERPYFERPVSRKHALRKGDATFVDIIHTSKGIRGYAKSHGDVDFYPNEGISPQPNCTGETHTILEEDCSHFQALFYFKESISSKHGFIARRCMVGSCSPGEATMGEHATPAKTGNYYLKTNSESPYARGRIDFS